MYLLCNRCLPLTRAHHREDAVRRAMQSLQSLKSVSFADKENVNTRMRIKVF